MNKTTHKILIVCLCTLMLLGCESDAEKRTRYKKIADEKYPWAGESGIGVAAQNHSDYDFAYRVWKPLAEKGDPDAQNFLGNLYSSGHAVKRDYVEAMKWYRKAAKQGHSGAMNNIAFTYERGHGVEEDYKEAVRWYERAAQKGHGLAMRRIADIYASIPDYRGETLAYMWYDITSKYAELSVLADEDRDEIARRMTPAQIGEAKKMVSEWEEKYGKHLKKYR